MIKLWNISTQQVRLRWQLYFAPRLDQWENNFTEWKPLEGVKITHLNKMAVLTGVQIAFTDASGNYKYTVPKDSQSYWITITKKEGYQTIRERWGYVAPDQHLQALNAPVRVARVSMILGDDGAKLSSATVRFP